MARAEDRHWWYLGLRDALQICLSQSRVRLPPNPVVLDVGCGTGGNLRFLSTLLQPAYLAGFDTNERAIRYARCKCPEADVYINDIRHPLLHRDNFDLIVICDVLYTSGLANSYSGLQTLVSAMSPGGVMVIHLPAFNWLASAHDAAVHTIERYRVAQLRRLLTDLQLETSLMSYRLCCLLPLVIMKRLPSIVARNYRMERSELVQPNPFLNRLLFQILRFENRLIARDIKLPFGSSILSVSTKLQSA